MLAGRYYKPFFLVCGILFSILSHKARAQTLSLDGYLKQVQDKHEGIRGMAETAEAAKLRAKEGTLLTLPSLFATINILDDKKPTGFPAFLGNETKFQGYSLGVAEQTRFGTTAKLSYTINNTELIGVDPNFFPVPSFYEVRPMLEVSQSLLRNGFGSETKATQQLLESQARATGFGEGFKIKMALAEAETTYWGLVVAREMVGVQSESVERAKKIRDWSAKRAHLELADKADLLQAEAGLQARTLEYQMAVDEEASAARSFNQLRGSDAEKVDDSLSVLEKDTLEKIAAVEKKGVREDVKAAEELKNLAEANAELGREKNLPDLNLSGTVALNGRSDGLGPAASDSVSTQFPTLGIGLKFSTPLDFGVLSDDRAAYLREIKGATLNYHRKVFEDAQAWKDLTTRLSDAKRRLALTWKIETAQSEKLTYEKERLKRGRSVTYQVLLFEQDFANAQTIRIKTESEILGLIAQMKTYGEQK